MISSSQAIRSLGSGLTGTPGLLWPVAVVADTRRRRRLAGAAAAVVVDFVAPLLVHGSAAPPPCYCAQVLCSLKPRTWFGLLNNVAADSVQIQHETQQGQNVNSVFCFWP